MADLAPPSRPTLSALVIARNEAGNIDRCLSALEFCDEVVVIDAESSDDTAARARRHGAKVWIEPWRGYAAQKAFALEKTSGAWVLWVDADEVVQPALRASILAAVARLDAPEAGYRLRRRVNYLGQWIRHGSFGNDWVLRLFRRERGQFSTHLVHEELLVDGPVGRLGGLLEHWSYRDLAHHQEKIEQMAFLWARQEAERGRRAGMLDLTVRPWIRALRLLVLEGGFRNGTVGWTIARMGAHYVRRKYQRLRLLNRAARID
ncbi:MAG: glycosyltransferase family 2 protein [Candidatus Eisenbacteria bacterium]|nr:glycosyltransferase family 2 protein [Candidatus Eisenbacteria bacterium]MCC7144424.1 glycosyltransferase family 2 protein [Candidatus Eisenbacteria bacterium]